MYGYIYVDTYGYICVYSGQSSATAQRLGTNIYKYICICTCIDTYGHIDTYEYIYI